MSEGIPNKATTQPAAPKKDLSGLMPYLRRYTGGIVVGLLTVLLMGIIGNVIPLATGVMTDTLAGNPVPFEHSTATHNRVMLPGLSGSALSRSIPYYAPNSRRTLGLYCLIVVVCVVLKGLLSFTARWELIGVSRDIEFDIRNDLLKRLLLLEPEFYVRNRTGELMSRATNDLNAVRMGGDQMRAAGVEIITDYSEVSVLGITEILSHLPQLIRAMQKLVTAAHKRRPELAILTDFPGFHLRLARKLKPLGARNIYYICPQFWAWRPCASRQPALSRSHCAFSQAGMLCSGNQESCTASPTSGWRTSWRECSSDGRTRSEAGPCVLFSDSCSRKHHVYTRSTEKSHACPSAPRAAAKRYCGLSPAASSTRSSSNHAIGRKFAAFAPSRTGSGRSNSRNRAITQPAIGTVWSPGSVVVGCTAVRADDSPGGRVATPRIRNQSSFFASCGSLFSFSSDTRAQSAAARATICTGTPRPN